MILLMKNLQNDKNTQRRTLSHGKCYQENEEAGIKNKKKHSQCKTFSYLKIPVKTIDI